MKKAVRENIEFITDRKILQKGTDSKQYQYSLVSVSLATAPNTIVNHFNISTIKKRIIMMNAKRSAGYNLTRYILLIPAVVALLLVFNLSKAEISKKGMHTFKSMATAITNVALINHDKPDAPAVKENTIQPLFTKTVIKNADTVVAGKSKDGKKAFFMTSDQSSDSLIYVINGVKGSQAELKSIDPARIYSLEMLPPDKAKEFFPAADGKHHVLFVTTDDSEAGKKLKAKMDKSVASGMISGNKAITIKGVNGASDIAPVAAGSSVSFSTNESADDAPIAVQPGAHTVTSVVVMTDANVNGKSKTWVKKNVTLAYAPKATVIVKNLNINTPAEDNVDVETVVPPADVEGKIYKFNAKEPKTKLYINQISTNDETTIDNPDMLFIIDGKEAKGMKNLSPADIKSISILKDEAAEKRYGEKGRNGVVVITTKKSK
ncbi:MAG: hypothetical protein JWP78_4043 [Mucilaginibacter sp.]|nr:hypothetical protein [Mucilaginibacter sp.]